MVMIVVVVMLVDIFERDGSAWIGQWGPPLVPTPVAIAPARHSLIIIFVNGRRQWIGLITNICGDVIVKSA